MPSFPLRLPMKRVAFALAVWLLLAGPSLLHAEDGVIDLGALPNYAKQAKPSYILLDNTPLGFPLIPLRNPLTDTGASLGRVLFYDKRLSRNDTVSCSSCHQQANAFGSAALVGTGVVGTTSRHAMRLVNGRFGGSRFFWDKRAATLEILSTQPIRSPIELGFSGTNGDPSFSDLIAKLSALPEYQQLFTAAFGSPLIDEARIQKALAQFVRSIQSFDSKYDAGRATNGGPNDPFPNFSASENRGKQLFLNPGFVGGAGCSFCHQPEEFANVSNGNNGVVGAIGGGTDLAVSRSPTLRDLFRPNGELNGPLMHNGSFTAVAQVIDHYSAVPDNPKLDFRLRQNGTAQTLNLTAQDRLDLEAFLLTLSGNAVYTDPKWSNPFRADGTITVTGSIPIPFPTPSLPTAQAVNLSTRLRIGTGDNVAIAGFIMKGSNSKSILIRGLGPSLANFGVGDALLDPVLDLRSADGTTLVQNDNWRDGPGLSLQGTSLQPADDREAAIDISLSPAAYTAVLSGKGQASGTGLLEIYDRSPAVDSELANISTRGFVGAQDKVMIGGFILSGNGNVAIVIRGLGPSLLSFGLTNVLADPKLELRDAHGVLLAANDNWGDNPSEAFSVSANGLDLPNVNEAAIITSLPPGQFTAILAGKNGASGIGIIEIYILR
jgi:cytochrome c peroxidase